MQNIINSILSGAYGRLDDVRKPMKYKHVTSFYDPEAQTFSNSTASVSFLGVRGVYKSKEIDNVNIKQGDIKLFVFSDIGFKVGNLVEIDGADYSIIDKIVSGGIVNLQLRNE